MDNTKKVKKWEDAYLMEGMDPQKSLPYQDPKNVEERALNAMAKTWKVIKVLNGGEVPDWNNWNQRKWELWWDMSGDPAVGSGFSLDDVYYAGSFTDVGSRLVFLDEKVARYFAKHFIDLVREWAVILPE